MDKLASQIIVEILSDEMALDDQRVWVRDQSRNIPNDDGLFLTVGLVDARPIYSKTELGFDGTNSTEINHVQIRENIQIDAFSRNQQAIQRRWEVIAALNSIAAQQAQEEHSFKIFRLPNSFVNASAAEGGSQLNRYSLLFSCLVWYKKEKTLSEDGSKVFDEFTTRYDDEATIGEAEGVFEFTINKDTEI